MNENVYLASAYFKNFQTYRGVTFEFSPGLNVITAPNGTGKTGVFRSIKFSLFYNNMTQADRSDFITKGETETTILYTLSNGYSFLFQATAKYINGYVFEGTTKILEDYEQTRQMFIEEANFVLSFDDKSILNLLSKEYLFVDTTEKYNADALGAAVRNQKCEYVIDGCELIESTLTPKYKNAKLRRDKLQGEYDVLEVYDMDSLLETKDITSYIIDMGTSLTSLAESLDYFLNRELELDTLSGVDSYSNNIDTLVELNTILSYLEYDLQDINIDTDKLEELMVNYLTELSNDIEVLLHNISSGNANIPETNLDCLYELNELSNTLSNDISGEIEITEAIESFKSLTSMYNLSINYYNGNLVKELDTKNLEDRLNALQSIPLNDLRSNLIEDIQENNLTGMDELSTMVDVLNNLLSGVTPDVDVSYESDLDSLNQLSSLCGYISKPISKDIFGEALIKEQERLAELADICPTCGTYIVKGESCSNE